MIMSRNEPKISAPQLFTLLILSRIMHTMIYHAAEFSSGTALMLTLVGTTAIECIAAIPLVKLITLSGNDPAGEIFKNERAANALRLLYSLYFLFISSGTLTYFTVFMNMEFPKVSKPFIITIILALAAAYCAYLGIEGLARAGAVILGTILALVIIISTVSEGEFDTLNLLPVTTKELPAMAEYALNDLSSSWWLPMLASLAPYLNGSAKKTAYGYILAKLVILEALLLLTVLVLWRFVEVLEYPLLALGAYAKTDFIQHFDAINMFVWTLNCIIVNASYIFIAAKPFIKKHRVLSVFLASAIAGGGAVYSYYRNINYNGLFGRAVKLGGVVILGVILPLIALTVRRIRSWKENIFAGSEQS